MPPPSSPLSQREARSPRRHRASQRQQPHGVWTTARGPGGRSLQFPACNVWAVLPGPHRADDACREGGLVYILSRRLNSLVFLHGSERLFDFLSRTIKASSAVW